VEHLRVKLLGLEEDVQSVVLAQKKKKKKKKRKRKKKEKRKKRQKKEELCFWLRLQRGSPEMLEAKSPSTACFAEN